MQKLMRCVLVVSLANCCHGLSASDELPVLLKDDFENGMRRWHTTDPKDAEPMWEIKRLASLGNQTAKNHVLRVKGTSPYKPPHRSPHSIALVKDLLVGDFELTVKLQNTNPKAGAHRDLCLFWGFQDPAHFYYVHLGAKPDPHSCQIFIVNEAPRTMITVDKSEGTPWTDGWHRVKIRRQAKDGVMEVYFDDMEKPVMTARDTTFTWGQVGLGTFDDNGNFDDFVLRGVEVKRPK